VLEILILWKFGAKVGEMAYRKGYNRAGFIIMFVGMWFGGEILGAIIGVILSGGRADDFGPIYGGALLGAVVGGVIGYRIVAALPDQYRPRTIPSDEYEENGRYQEPYEEEDHVPGRPNNESFKEGRPPSRHPHDTDEDRRRIQRRPSHDD